MFVLIKNLTIKDLYPNSLALKLYKEGYNFKECFNSSTPQMRLGT